MSFGRENDELGMGEQCENKGKRGQWVREEVSLPREDNVFREERAVGAEGVGSGFWIRGRRIQEEIIVGLRREDSGFVKIGYKGNYGQMD